MIFRSGQLARFAENGRQFSLGTLRKSSGNDTSRSVFHFFNKSHLFPIGWINTVRLCLRAFVELALFKWLTRHQSEESKLIILEPEDFVMTSVLLHKKVRLV